MSRFRGILFDLDGTLLDSLSLILKCFEHTLVWAGKKPRKNEEVMPHVGLPLRDQYHLYMGDIPEEKMQSIMTEHMRFQMNNWSSHLRLYPGVTDTLTQLNKLNIPMAVVTSRRQESAELYTRELGIRDYFQALVTPEKTRHHKPHPEPALLGLSILKLKADEVVFVGDSSFDMGTAKGAGISACCVSWGATPPDRMNPPADFQILKMSEIISWFS